MKTNILLTLFITFCSIPSKAQDFSRKYTIHLNKGKQYYNAKPPQYIEALKEFELAREYIASDEKEKTNEINQWNEKCKNAIKKANKLMGKKGRILVRKSGTEPKIRIMAESYDKSLISKCIKIIKRSIK